MATSKRIMAFTLDPRTTDVQVCQAPAGRVIHFKKDDMGSDVADVWVEAMREDMNVAESHLVEAVRKFVVVRGLGDVPDGYIHVASTVSETGDSYHLYELFKELEDIPVVPAKSEPTVREYIPILAFRLITNGKLSGHGEVDRDGAVDLIEYYADYGYFQTQDVIDRALSDGHCTLVLNGRGKEPHSIRFSKI